MKYKNITADDVIINITIYPEGMLFIVIVLVFVVLVVVVLLRCHRSHCPNCCYHLTSQLSFKIYSGLNLLI